MKRWIMVFALLSICSVAVATIQKDRIANRVIGGLSDARSASLRCRTALDAVKTDLQDLNTTYGAEIEAADKTLLTSVFSDITDAITELNDLMLNIDTNFPTIQ